MLTGRRPAPFNRVTIVVWASAGSPAFRKPSASSPLSRRRLPLPTVRAEPRNCGLQQLRAAEAVRPAESRGHLVAIAIEWHGVKAYVVASTMMRRIHSSAVCQSPVYRKTSAIHTSA